MTEELTAEERAWCLTAAYNAPCVQRLLRLYDAALARAAELEADQKRHLESIAGEARCLGQLRTDLDTERSRIAQAVAELEHYWDVAGGGRNVQAAMAILKGEAT
jgi:hypothetical protein